MAITTIEQLKQWFRKGLYPTQAQFWAWLDSYRHKSESVPMSEVSGLTGVLNNKYEKSEAQSLERAVNSAVKGMEYIQTEMEDMHEKMQELRDTLTDRSYTLDFGDRGTTMQDVNMEAEEVKIMEVRTFNVARLLVTCGELVRVEVDPEDTESIKIASGSLATWEIEREADGVPAAVGIRCRRTGERANDEELKQD